MLPVVLYRKWWVPVVRCTVVLGLLIAELTVYVCLCTCTAIASRGLVVCCAVHCVWPLAAGIVFSPVDRNR
jgi:hypothetical protein